MAVLGLGYGTRDIDVGLSGARDFTVHSERKKTYPEAFSKWEFGTETFS